MESSDSFATGRTRCRTRTDWRKRPGSCLIAAAHGRLTPTVLWKALLTTVEVSGLAMLIITTSTAFSQVLAHTGAATALASFATSVHVSPLFIVVDSWELTTAERAVLEAAVRPSS